MRLLKPGRLSFCDVSGRYWPLPRSSITLEVAKCWLSNSLIPSSFISQNTPIQRNRSSLTIGYPESIWERQDKCLILSLNLPFFSEQWAGSLAFSKDDHWFLTKISLRSMDHIAYRFETSNRFDVFQSIAVNSYQYSYCPICGFLALTRCFLFLTRCFKLVIFPLPDLEAAISPRLPGFFFLMEKSYLEI